MLLYFSITRFLQLHSLFNACDLLHYKLYVLDSSSFYFLFVQQSTVGFLPGKLLDTVVTQVINQM